MMDSKYKPDQYQEKLYSFWEKNDYFNAKVDSTKKPFCIILPPPNANGNLHLGHAMFVYEDVMIRYKKMLGYETLWLLGLDHAGIETQFVYEKHLKKQGKSRFDYSREELFKNIWDFVMENKGTIKGQMRQLGFALDWSKEKFTMDEDIVQTIYTTFEHLFNDGLVYRDFKLVNYCTSCGTSFSDLEVNDKEAEGLLYHIKFPVKGGGEIVIATTRPETYVGDVAVMVHPKDKRYQEMIGKTVLLPLTNREIPIIADDYVDMKFGTGAVKVTPYHDFNDFEIAKKHKLTRDSVIGFDGKMQNTGMNELDGLYVTKARKYLVEQLQEKGYLIKTVPHHMVLKICYRCGTVLQPLPKEQWFIKIKPLANKAVELVEKNQIRVFPKRFKKQLTSILENFIDWNISRQIVWGIRIPAFYNVKTGEWIVETDPVKQKKLINSGEYKQDEDTFDTWFSSAQWPFATLKSIDQQMQKNDPTTYKLQPTSYFDYYYPTSVMETGYDILRAWVARMIMIGYFETKKVPFENVFLHGMVRDKHGMKMSKSKGNVIDPLLMVDKYGADALRAALVFGTKEGGDVVLSEDKIIGMRNFGNKIWNIGRFIEMNLENNSSNQKPSKDALKELKQLEKEFAQLNKRYHKHFEKYEFAKAFDETYEFLWHRFADYYIEQLKEEMKNGTMEVSEKLKEIYFKTLQMLHPYMPFVTEAVWQSFHGEKSSLLDVLFNKNS